MRPVLQRLKERLARATSSGRYIAEIDGLRFMAIAAVVIQHVQQALARYPSPPIPYHGIPSRLVADTRLGVELFFLISGFILSLPFVIQHAKGGRSVSLKAYYWRRLTRLEPPYLIALIAIFGCKIAGGAGWAQLIPHLGAGLIYSHNIVYNQFNTIIPPAWSLEVEVQFYVLAPFLALIFTVPSKALRRIAILGIAVVLFEVKHLIERRHGILPETLLTYLQYFLMGFLAADIYATDWRERPSCGRVFDSVALLGWGCMPFVFLVSIPARSMVVSLLLLGLVLASFRSSLVLRFLRFPLVTTIGGMCYTIYLLHWGLLQFASSFLRVASRTVGQPRFSSTLVATVIFWALLLPVCLIFFVLVEKPCMRKEWPTKLLARVRTCGRKQADAPPTAPGTCDYTTSGS